MHIAWEKRWQVDFSDEKRKPKNGISSKMAGENLKTPEKLKNWGSICLLYLVLDWLWVMPCQPLGQTKEKNMKWGYKTTSCMIPATAMTSRAGGYAHPPLIKFRCWWKMLETPWLCSIQVFFLKWGTKHSLPSLKMRSMLRDTFAGVLLVRTLHFKV